MHARVDSGEIQEVARVVVMLSCLLFHYFLSSFSEWLTHCLHQDIYGFVVDGQPG